MNFYLLAALASGLFFSVNGVIYKISNKHAIRDPLRLLFYIYLWQIPVSLTALFFTKVSFPVEFLLGFLLFNSCFFMGGIFVGLAVVHLDASVFLPLFNIQVILTSLFAFWLLGESFGAISYLLMAIIVLGGLLVSSDEHFSVKVSRPIVLLLLGLVFYSLGDAFAGQIIKSFGVLNLRFWSSLLLGLFSLFLPPFFRVREKVTWQKLVPVFLVGFFGFLGLISLAFGFIYSVSLSQALAKLSSVYSLVIVVLLAKFKGDFLEKHPWPVYLLRFLGSLIMVTAAVTLLILNG